MTIKVSAVLGGRQKSSGVVLLLLVAWCYSQKTAASNGVGSAPVSAEKHRDTNTNTHTHKHINNNCTNYVRVIQILWLNKNYSN